jgi:hypothetical protein
VRLQFIPRDLWVGVFIGPEVIDRSGKHRRIYVCPLPCVVFSFRWRLRMVDGA